MKIQYQRKRNKHLFVVGSTLPEELRRKLESKVSMTPEEEELFVKEKKDAIKQEKVQ